MFLDINTHIRFEGNDRNAQVSFSNLEAFAGPAQSPRVDVPPSAAVSGSLAGVKRRVDTVPSVWRIANGMVPVSPIGTTGSLPRIDATGRT